MAVAACPPLQSFLRLRHEAQIAMGDCQAASFYFGVLNVAPKLALGKLTLAGCTPGAFSLQAHDGSVRLVPTGTRSDYWTALHDHLAAGATVMQVPEWAAMALKPHYKVEKQQDEFLISEWRLRTLAGGRLSRLRAYMHEGMRRLIIAPMTNPDPYIALNAKWYQQNRALKFRTYDKTSIEWVLRNWHDLKDWCPDICCLGARDADTMELVGFAMGSMLTKDTWSCYTRRFDRESPVHSPHILAFQSLGARFPKAAYENDGTGGDATLRKDKSRMAEATLSFYTVRLK